ncbi:MAG: hypothetical protein AB3N19_18485 [Ruegeria sp.]
MTSKNKTTVVQNPSKKTCFVVSPIGSEGTATRRRADCLLHYIIEPAVKQAGYDDPVRVDKHDQPTHITSDIVSHLIEADLVVADISGENANVFYELGIRHAFKKPCIILSNWENPPPFDVSGLNVVRYTHDDPVSHKDSISRIIKQIESFEGGKEVSNPVTIANGYAKLDSSGDDRDALISQMGREVMELKAHVRFLAMRIPSSGRVIDDPRFFPDAKSKRTAKNAITGEEIDLDSLLGPPDMTE